MKPFYISYDGKKEDIQELIESTFDFFEKIAQTNIPRYVCEGIGSGPYESASWYTKQAFNYQRNQVSSEKLRTLFNQEPWQKTPHYEFFVTDRDMYNGSPNNAFLFGETNPQILHNGSMISNTFADGSPYVKYIMLSTNRLKKYYEKEWDEAFQTIAIHELGHMYGLASQDSPDYITHFGPKDKSGLEGGHCDRKDCIMEQVNVSGRMDLRDKKEYLEEVNPYLFCNNDLRALKVNIRKL